MTSRWITQTQFYDPDKPGNGNCMQASVASLLSLELDQVPHFAESGDPGTCWDLFEEFMESQGLYPMMLSGDRVLPVMYLASGKSARGVSHMVVMNGGELVHDPHPSRAGLLKVDLIYVLVPIRE